MFFHFRIVSLWCGFECAVKPSSVSIAICSGKNIANLILNRQSEILNQSSDWQIEAKVHFSESIGASHSFQHFDHLATLPRQSAECVECEFGRESKRERNCLSIDPSETSTYNNIITWQRAQYVSLEWNSKAHTRTTHIPFEKKTSKREERRWWSVRLFGYIIIVVLLVFDRIVSHSFPHLFCVVNIFSLSLSQDSRLKSQSFNHHITPPTTETIQIILASAFVLQHTFHIFLSRSISVFVLLLCARNVWNSFCSNCITCAQQRRTFVFRSIPFLNDFRCVSVWCVNFYDWPVVVSNQRRCEQRNISV